MSMTGNKRLIVGITGATGVIFGVRALELLRSAGVETHVVMSKWGARTLLHETSHSIRDVQNLATAWYGESDMGAAISSGSFLSAGMLVLPCSVRTLAAIATGLGDNLIHRAASVMLKERRKLVLAVREAPFTEIDLEHMLRLARMGVVISTPAPAFYNHPKDVADLVDHTVARLLDQFDIHLDARPRWEGMKAPERPGTREIKQ